jgi:hypothetical protein
MASLKRAIEVLGVGVEAQTRNVVLNLKGDDQSTFQVRLAPNIVASIAVTLFSLGKHVTASDNEGIEGQVMVLTGAIPARGPQRQPVLDLVFSGGLHFPVTFQEEMIPIFHKAFATLQHTSIGKTPPTESRN